MMIDDLESRTGMQTILPPTLPDMTMPQSGPGQPMSGLVRPANQASHPPGAPYQQPQMMSSAMQQQQMQQQLQQQQMIQQQQRVGEFLSINS